jgi:hypothetical protein
MGGTSGLGADDGAAAQDATLAIDNGIVQRLHVMTDVYDSATRRNCSVASTVGRRRAMQPRRRCLSHPDFGSARRRTLRIRERNHRYRCVQIS